MLCSCRPTNNLGGSGGKSARRRFKCGILTPFRGAGCRGALSHGRKLLGPHGRERLSGLREFAHGRTFRRSPKHGAQLAKTSLCKHWAPAPSARRRAKARSRRRKGPVTTCREKRRARLDTRFFTDLSSCSGLTEELRVNQGGEFERLRQGLREHAGPLCAALGVTRLAPDTRDADSAQRALSMPSACVRESTGTAISSQHVAFAALHSCSSLRLCDPDSSEAMASVWASKYCCTLALLQLPPCRSRRAPSRAPGPGRRTRPAPRPGPGPRPTPSETPLQSALRTSPSGLHVLRPAQEGSRRCRRGARPSEEHKAQPQRKCVSTLARRGPGARAR